MNTRIFLIVSTALLAISSATIHLKSEALQVDISAGQAQCDDWLSKLQAQYAAQPVKIVRQAPRSRQQPQTEHQIAEDTQPMVDIEQLVSYGHQVQAVSNKYEFLLLSAQIDKSDKELLRRLLVRRERLENGVILAEQGNGDDISALEEQLYEVEDHIQVVLTDPLDYQRYEFLRNRQL